MQIAVMIQYGRFLPCIFKGFYIEMSVMIWKKAKVQGVLLWCSSVNSYGNYLQLIMTRDWRGSNSDNRCRERCPEASLLAHSCPSEANGSQCLLVLLIWIPFPQISPKWRADLWGQQCESKHNLPLGYPEVEGSGACIQLLLERWQSQIQEWSTKTGH